MKRDLILIITSKQDSHTDVIIDKLNSQGIEERVIRLNTEDFWSNTEIATDGSNFQVKIKDSNRSFDSDRVSKVWFRRPKEIEVYHADEAKTAFIQSQSIALLRGLYFCTHDTALWINPLPSLHRSRIKLQQIQLARKLGMQVPQTLVTNIPDRAIEFVKNVSQACTKSLQESSFTSDGHIFPFYTRLVTEREVRENLSAIEVCYTLFQEYIDKKYDLRVTVIGDEIFALAMHSQDSEMSKVDVRGLAPARMNQKLVEIPVLLKEQIFSFVRQQGLIFSAMDFAVTADERYVFLENNPNGQWQWIDDVAEGSLSDAMISLLLGNKSPN